MKTQNKQAGAANPGEIIHKTTFLQDVMRRWQLYLILLVPLVLVIIFAYTPMTGIIIGFKDFSVRKGIFGSDWVGLEHFQTFFESSRSTQIIINTIILSFYQLFAGVPVPIILAICLNEMNNAAFKKTVQMVTYAPYFISIVVIVSMLTMFTDSRIGIINLITGVFGIEPVNFMGVSAWFRHLYVWSGVWQSSGYGAVIYIAALSSVPTELYESAKIDGANKWKKIFYIDLPLILPTVSIMLILNVGQVMNLGFEKVYLMQNSANSTISEVMSTYVYKMGLVNMNMGFSTAINFFNSFVNLILVLTVNAISKKISNTSLV